ncbi:hypothetical protein [Pseudomonas aeruginosa]
MTDHAELRRLAEEVIRIERNEDEPISAAWELFDSAANPKTILALLDEIVRLKAENEVLRGALKPFAEFERVRSAMGGNAPREGILYGVHSNTGSAELHVEHMQTAQSALEGAAQ